MDDLKKAIKREKKRFARKKREIRESVKEEMLDLVEERVRSFKEYLRRWCSGSEKGREEEETEDGEGVQGARQKEGEDQGLSHLSENNTALGKRVRKP